MDRDTGDKQDGMTWNDIIQAAAVVIRPIVRDEIRAALEAERKRQEAEARKAGDKRRSNAKLLLEHYRGLKAYIETAADDIRDELDDAVEDGQEMADLMRMVSRWDVRVQSMEMTAARTYSIMRKVDKRLKCYRTLCEMSADEKQQRRWRVIYARYLADIPSRTAEIAANEFVDVRTIQRDIDTACQELGGYLFGEDVLKL